MEQEQKEVLLNSAEVLAEEIRMLKRELSEKDKKLEDHQNDSEILKDLYRNGFIDEDGNVIQ